MAAVATHPPHSHSYDLALAIVRRMFPTAPFVHELNRKLALAAVAANGGRCKERGCPWPVLTGRTRCRRHLDDLLAQVSVLPSALGPERRSPRQPSA